MDAYLKALDLLLDAVPAPLPPVKTRLTEARGLVLAAPVYADIDVPPFNKAMVDGFAFRSADAASYPVTLPVAGEVAAGTVPNQPCLPGDAWHVMTGAPVPEGADAVAMIERVGRPDGDRVEIVQAPGTNISLQGSEVKQGDCVVEAGRRLDAATIGVLAMFGRAQIEVYPPPRTTIATTGAELVDLDGNPSGAQIRDSNLEMLRAAAGQAGLDPRTCRIGDDVEALRSLVREVKRPGILIVSGGLSMGEYDYVPEALQLEGARILFHRLPIRPGKPVLAAVLDDLFVVGLPGNPVSALVTFYLFARPLIRKLMGHASCKLPEVQVAIEEAVPPAGARTFFAPAQTRLAAGEFRATLIKTKGSADLTRFSRANSLLVIPAGSEGFPAGTRLRALLPAEDWVIEDEP